MTFEEFLLKKKIDPVQLRAAKPSLFSEFNSNFQQMGEKSFDHSKKFWFNKLRRAYLLEEEPKLPREGPEVNPVASQAEPLISPTIEATGYKPRFKPKLTAAEENDPAIIAKAPDSQEKPVYKPRFKPGMTPPKQKEK